MNIKIIIASFAFFIMGNHTILAQSGETPSKFIGKMQPIAKTNTLTPENLWAMGRIGTFSLSPDGRNALYNVSYYSVEQNKSHSVIYTKEADCKEKMLTVSTASEYHPSYIHNGKHICYLSSVCGTMQLWMMDANGENRKQISHEGTDIIDYLFSPDETKVILIKEVPNPTSIQNNDADLPLSSGMVCNDLMYKHWDTYVTSAPHPFIATFNGQQIVDAYDIMEGEPYEAPMMPFGGIEQLAWSPDGKQVAYTSRKLTGKAYALSTDSDIYLYDIATKSTKNLCKPEGYVRPEVDATSSFAQQAINQNQADCNMGYDQNPQFSPDGQRIAWLSMERDGYESDRSRLCVYDFPTGTKQYVTEEFQSSVNEFVWSNDGKKIFFTGVWHGKTHIYHTNLKGKVLPITEGQYDYVLLGLTPNGKNLLAKRHSMSEADEVFSISLDGKTHQLTHENQAFYEGLSWGEVKERWITTTDNKQMLAWVIYPPHFDATKKHPTLLFCEGGPQSPVSQFWSYRWNFQVMAAQGYIVIAPNRRGLPGFGMEWLEQISGDYSGQCMRDYLSAIDDICREPYVDTDRLGAVGASFGGYSVYWLAGNHEKRFKAFIAHDGIFNTQQQYVETEEMWFPNWDMTAAPWIKDAKGKMKPVFETSPHLYVDRWDTPILCIHGQRDFRIEYTQAESAFTAARLRGIPAQLLLFPDENHWVLKPQNGILWQRTFFRWLDKWLKTANSQE